jgi:hypothetical protein
MTDLGHWTCTFTFDPADFTGFIYRITNLTNKRMYIGKKFFSSTTRKKVKNRKNRKRVIKESNWKKYTGSCKTLNEDIELLGKDNFKFEIISCHESRSSLAYREVELHVKLDVLRSKYFDGSRLYYNGLIPPIKFMAPDYTPNELSHTADINFQTQ